MQQHRVTYHEIEQAIFATCTCGWRSRLHPTLQQVEQEHEQHKEEA